MNEWNAETLRDQLAQLYLRGGDSTTVEVKRAAGGLPSTLPHTLCAFANMPGGGTIILGVDEAASFSVTGVDDPAAMEAAVASQARQAVTPPVTVETQSVTLDSKHVVIVQVRGLPITMKPATTSGIAYLRQADGDYPMSDNELRMIEVAKLHAADEIQYDQRAIPGTSVEDLDSQLLAPFLERVRTENRRLASVEDDSRLLNLLQVTTANGELTLAGNYALGFYPQGANPALNLTIAERLPRNPQGARTQGLTRVEGPIPVLLDEAMRWVKRNVRVTQQYAPDGHMVDTYDIPINAVREAIANALVHRNLGPDTLGVGAAIDVRLTPQNLVITSPGGLRGLTVENLKTEQIYRREVNQRLYTISRYLETSDGRRVIEGEGGGIREMFLSAREAGLPDPDLIDAGVRFTVVIWRPAVREQERDLVMDPAKYAAVSRNAPAVVRVLMEKDATSTELAEATGLSDGQVRYALRALIDAHLVAMVGGQGDRRTEYHWRGE